MLVVLHVQVVETIVWSVLGLRYCTCVQVLDTILVQVVILVTGALLLVHLVGLNTKILLAWDSPRILRLV